MPSGGFGVKDGQFVGEALVSELKLPEPPGGELAVESPRWLCAGVRYCGRVFVLVAAASRGTYQTAMVSPGGHFS
jgi:hypothetical protein